MSDGRRAALAEALATPCFDLLVIGGGINGAGIARDAAMRGLSVALVEQGRLRERYQQQVLQADPRRPALPRELRVRARARGEPRARSPAPPPGAASRPPDAVRVPDLPRRSGRALALVGRSLGLRRPVGLPEHRAPSLLGQRTTCATSRSSVPTACAARCTTTIAGPTTRASRSRPSSRRWRRARSPAIISASPSSVRTDGRLSAARVIDRLSGDVLRDHGAADRERHGPVARSHPPA